VVVAPGCDEVDWAGWRRKKGLRLLAVGELRTDVRTGPNLLDLKKIVGGLILQDRDLGAILDVRTLKVASHREPTDQEYAAFAFAWKVCKHVKSNAIVFARRDRTVGIGAGQMSRVD